MIPFIKPELPLNEPTWKVGCGHEKVIADLQSRLASCEAKNIYLLDLVDRIGKAEDKNGWPLLRDVELMREIETLPIPSRP